MQPNLTYQPTSYYQKDVRVRLRPGQVGNRQMFDYDEQLDGSTIVGIRFNPGGNIINDTPATIIFSPRDGSYLFITNEDAQNMLVVLRDDAGNQIMKPYPLLGLAGFQELKQPQPTVTFRCFLKNIALRKSFIVYSNITAFGTGRPVYADFTFFYKK